MKHKINWNTIIILISIVMIIGMIFYNSKANAETAWVKWEHITHYTEIDTGVKTSDYWVRQEAYPAYESCMSNIHKAVNGVCNNMSRIYNHCDEGNDFIMASGIHEIIIYLFYCYPDTIDPRK